MDTAHTVFTQLHFILHQKGVSSIMNKHLKRIAASVSALCLAATFCSAISAGAVSLYPKTVMTKSATFWNKYANKNIPVMTTRLITVSFKSSKSLDLFAFTMDTNKAAGKAYVNTSLFRIFESVLLNTFRLPDIYPKNMMTKMGRMSFISISIINNYFTDE